MNTNLDKTWYAVRVISGTENKVKSSISLGATQRNIGESLGDILVVTETVKNLKSKRDTVRNLYPGYIFINMLLNSEIKNLVSSIPNVIGFAGDKRNPKPMPEKEIAQLLKFMAKPVVSQDEILIRGFSVGEKVRLNNAGLNGIISSIDLGKNRIVVSANIFEREVTMEVKPDQIEKVS